MSGVKISPTTTASWRCGSMTRPAARCYLSALLSGPSRAFHLAHQIRIAGKATDRAAVGQKPNSRPRTRNPSAASAGELFRRRAGRCPTAPSQPRPRRPPRYRAVAEPLRRQLRAGLRPAWSTLQRPGARGVPFYFVRSTWRAISPSGTAPPAFTSPASAAPVPWNVHEAFAQPGKILVQLARCRTMSPISASRAAYQARRRLSEADAPVRHRRSAAKRPMRRKWSIRPGWTSATPTLPCRSASAAASAERGDCQQRALPPIGSHLTVNETTAARALPVPPRLGRKWCAKHRDGKAVVG